MRTTNLGRVISIITLIVITMAGIIHMIPNVEATNFQHGSFTLYPMDQAGTSIINGCEAIIYNKLNHDDYEMLTCEMDGTIVVNTLDLDWTLYDECEIDVQIIDPSGNYEYIMVDYMLTTAIYNTQIKQCGMSIPGGDDQTYKCFMRVLDTVLQVDKDDLPDGPLSYYGINGQIYFKCGYCLYLYAATFNGYNIRLTITDYWWKVEKGYFALNQWEEIDSQDHGSNVVKYLDNRNGDANDISWDPVFTTIFTRGSETIDKDYRFSWGAKWYFDSDNDEDNVWIRWGEIGGYDQETEKYILAG